MKVTKTIPTNDTFFQTYGKYHSLILFGIILAQIVSAGSEIGVLYSFAADAAAVMGEQFAHISGIVVAIVGILLIEFVGMRVTLPGATDAIIYGRFRSILDAAFSVAFIVTTVVLLGGSYYLSMQGGEEVVNYLQNKTQFEQGAQIQASSDTKSKELKEGYDQRANAIEERYTALIAAEENKAKAANAVAKTKYETWRKKGKKYKTRTARELAKWQQVDADKATAIAALQVKKSEEITALQARFDNQSDEGQASSKNALASSTASIEERTTKFKTASAWLVRIAILFAFVFTVMNRIFYAGSGIEEKAEAGNAMFLPSLSSELSTLVQDKFQISLRNQIANSRASMAQLKPYTSNLPLYDVASLQRGIVHLQNELNEQTLMLNAQGQLSQGQNVQQLPQTTAINANDLQQQIEQLTRAQIALTDSNKHNAAQAVELQAKQVIKLYLERNNQSTTHNEVNDFQHKVIDHINEPKRVANPFSTTANTIGFKQQNNATDSSNNIDRYNGDRYQANSSSENGTQIQSNERTKNCKNCGQSFTYKHWNKQYCSDDCKLDWHAKQNGGKRFDPSYHSKRKK